jgi:hypothetical protein
MQKTITFGVFIFSSILFWGCSNSDNSSKNETQIAEKQSIVQILDSNYVLENITILQNFVVIEKRFGKENLVKDSTIAGPEGTTINVSVLFPKTPNEVILYWKEKHEFTKLDAVVIHCDSAGYLGKWHSKLGLQAGQNLEKVIELNQKPFTISGFGWDYGGHIVSWEGGKLDNKQVTGRFADFGKNKITDSEYQSISGDTEFNVSLGAIKKLNPVLKELTVFGK